MAATDSNDHAGPVPAANPRSGRPPVPRNPAARRPTRAVVGGVLALVIALVTAACSIAPPLSATEQVEEIAAFVERVRGHDFLTDPDVQFLDPADFRAEVLANLAAEEARIAPDEAAFVALDWMDASEDLLEQYRLAYGDGVVGFYDPVSGALKVRGTDLTAYRREVIAHELTHALDDQVHDLSDLASEGLLDDRYLSALVAVEGSAERVRDLWYRSRDPLEQFQSLAEQLDTGSVADLLEVPVALLTLTTAPYLRGLSFQRDLVGRLGNPAGPDLSLTRYPATTEQAFHTEAYLAEEPAADLPAPPTDGGAPVVRSGTAGPLLLSLVLREGLVLDSLDPRTTGWAGGSYATWYDGSSACMRIDSAWDDSARADTIAGALQAWGDLHGGTSVVRPGPDTVRATRCD